MAENDGWNFIKIRQEREIHVFNPAGQRVAIISFPVRQWSPLSQKERQPIRCEFCNDDDIELFPCNHIPEEDDEYTDSCPFMACKDHLVVHPATGLTYCQDHANDVEGLRMLPEVRETAEKHGGTRADARRPYLS